jgi:hypothetical protein
MEFRAYGVNRSVSHVSNLRMVRFVPLNEPARAGGRAFQG